MLSPYLGGALGVVAVPALLMLVISFFRYDALSTPTWVGWKNFNFIFADPLTQVAFFNTLFFAVLAVPLRLLVALGLALLYQRERPGAGIYRAFAFLPSIVPDAAYALLWLWILNPLYGPLNGILRWVGLEAPGWLTDYQWAKPGMVLMWTFQVAEGLVLLLAALKSLPQETLDAARVDGANRLNVFGRIILPLIAPWLALTLLNRAMRRRVSGVPEIEARAQELDHARAQARDAFPEKPRPGVYAELDRQALAERWALVPPLSQTIIDDRGPR